MDGVDDLGVVDALEVDRGDAEVAVSERRWMTTSGTPSRAISTAWACRSWCGAKRRRTPALAAVRRRSARAAALAQCRPRVAPVTMQNSGPTGSSRRVASHGWSCCQPHASMPTSRRRPPLPWQTSNDPRRWSRSASPSESASWIRSPARQRITTSPRSRCRILNAGQQRRAAGARDSTTSLPSPSRRRIASPARSSRATM